MTDGIIPKPHRVFISYRHDPDQRATVLSLERALRAEGVEVWRDEHEIGPFRDIKAALHRGLRDAHALLAYYDPAYPERAACLWELTSALIAGAHDDAMAVNPTGARVLVVTPGENTDHVRPLALRARLMLSIARDGVAAVARAVRVRLADIDTPMGNVAITPPALWVGLPVKSSFVRFVGRLREMWEIFDALSADPVFLRSRAAAPVRGGVASAHLHSWGGVGKSVLAAEYARRYAPFYPGGVFWLSATVAGEDWREAARIGLRGVAVALAIDVDDFDQLARDFPDPAQSLARARGMLGRELARGGQPYLWIVDDLPDGASQEEALGWMAPDERGYGRSLFTTRDAAMGQPGVTINLGMLDGDSAFELLTYAREPDDEPERSAAQGFLALVDCYPLVIDIAGQLVGSFYFTGFAELLEAASHPERDHRVLDVEAGLRLHLPGRANASIVATLLRSFDFLASLKDGAIALDILRLASLLAPQHEIPYSLLEEVIGADIAQARRHLHQAAMVQAGREGLSVHPVICRAIALCSPAARLMELRDSVVAGLTRRMEVASDVDQFRSCDGLIAHVEALTRRIEGPRDAVLLGSLASYHDVAGQTRVAVALYRRQHAALISCLGSEHLDTLVCLSNLAKALRELGELADARAKLEHVLTVFRDTLTEEHSDTLAIANLLAETLRAQGDYTGAEAMHRRTLLVRRRLHGEDDQATLISMINLAGTLQDFGKPDEALTLHRAVLEATSRIKGENHFDALIAQNNLAQTLRGIGEYAEALALQESAASGLSRLFGPEHPATLTSRSNLATTLRLLNRLTEAEELAEDVLQVRRQTRGDAHPQTAMHMGNLSTVLLARGKVVEALALGKEAIAVCERALGPDHPTTLTEIANLAAILLEQGQPETARQLLEQVLDARQRFFGNDHPSTLTTEANLAGTLRRQGDLRGARDRYSSALGSMREKLGLGHPLTQSVMRDLAVTLEELRDWPAARALYTRLLEIRRQTLGEQHTETLNVMNDLANVMREMKDLTAARSLLERTVEITTRVLGADDDHTLIGMSNLAGVLEAQGEDEQALTLAMDVLERRVHKLGIAHPATLTSMSNVAWSLHSLGDHEAATALWRKALPAAREVWGDDHPYTTSIRDALEPVIVKPAVRGPDDPVPPDVSEP